MVLPERSDMAGNDNVLRDDRLEKTIGNLLRWGVILSSAIVLMGGILYLIENGMKKPDYVDFKSTPQLLRTFGGIVAEVMKFHARGLIQLGLLLLIATPIARVVFSVVAFWRQKDYLYTIVTLLVFLILLFSLLLGQV